ncbi:MAG: NTP transferase domain-containing protein [Bacteroidaceae bacterium]
MKYAIIAAGEGSRLSKEGIEQPKPLVELCGEPMMDRLVRIFTNCGATEIVVICNCLTNLVRIHLEELAMKRNTTQCPIRIVQQTTPSSMHSFYCLSPYLTKERFCLTTVDTVFKEDEFKKFIRHFEMSKNDGMMAVTDYVDDESPLYVGTDSNLNIKSFNDSKKETDRYISGGIYCLTPKAITTLQRCIKEGTSRMRNFQRALIEDGLQLQAYPFSKILDVDHASDIEKAERFCKQGENE